MGHWRLVNRIRSIRASRVVASDRLKQIKIMRKNQFNFFICPLLLVALFVFFYGSSAAQNKSSKYGTICGDAAKAECTKNDSIFKPFSLVFKLSAKALKDPEQYAEDEQSEFFYAVLLETVKGYKEGGGCREINEAKRLAAQKMFPNNKAFSYNIYCDPAGEGDKFIEYKAAGLDETIHLLGVYGGAAQADAAKILSQAKKKYPKARVVKMRAVVVEQHDV